MKLRDTFLRIITSAPPGALDGITNNLLLLTEAQQEQDKPKPPMAFT